MNKTDFDSITIGNWNQRFLNFLKIIGVERVTLNYSGGGDSGGVDSIEFRPTKVHDEIKTCIEELEESLSNPIYNRHGGFADGGGYHVDGQVDYDSLKNTVIISGSDHNTTYSYNEKDEDYEENENWVEEWEEVIFDAANESKTRYNPDFEFAYYYADLNKQKFSEEIHNRILAEAATKDDEWAKKYIELF